MNKNNSYKDLQKISQYLGLNIAYAQGGGGNTSVKINNEELIIKASGFKLSDVTTTSGFVRINFRNYKSELSSKIDDLSEEDYSKLGLKYLTGENSGKPSIETCFHATINQSHIIHSHSIFANIISCSIEGESILSTLIPEAFFIEYDTPGKNLAKKIINKLEDVNESSETIIFLQNHGLIVGSNNASTCIDIHETINTKIKKHFNLPDFKLIDLNADVQIPVLFPDQAVYNTGDNTSIAAKETMMAARYIYKTIEQLNLNPSTLPVKEVEYLLNMESEKFRKKMAGSC